VQGWRRGLAVGRWLPAKGTQPGMLLRKRVNNGAQAFEIAIPGNREFTNDRLREV
jgi:hypothetical protein